MNHIKKTDRLDIFIEESQKSILIQQKWKYDWIATVGTSPWIYKEKKEFHTLLDQLIWSQWAGRVKLEAQGGSDFVQRNSGYAFTVNFDIKWVLSGQHWMVNVKKIPAGSFESSNVIWNSRIINLDTEDVKQRQVAAGFFQYPAAHEFGHAVGNSIYAYSGAHGDEYSSSSSFYTDQHSIMNIGHELRRRHVDFVIRELNAMIPDTTFHVLNVR